MFKQFDVIVIGTGPCGSTVANTCSGNGLKTAIIDSRGYGGTCPLRGCNPKKVLASATELIDKNNRMQQHGIQSGNSIDWKELIDFKRTFTAPVPEAKEKSLKEAGVATFHGQANFVSENEVHVNNQTLEGTKIVIATGARPADLPIKGKEHLTYSHEFLELDTLPKRVIFVGGGYISFEFAHIAARAGSEVHIVQRGGNPLKAFDPDLVKLLLKKSEEKGIHVHLNTSVNSIEKREDGFSVIAIKNKEKVTFAGDIVIHGGGRVPEIDDLHLEQGNVRYKNTGITVNEFSQSVSNPAVYAAGDAADTVGAPLTPVAQLEAAVVSENILKGNKEQADYTGVPSVVFTTPKLATAGLSEQQAIKSGYNTSTNFVEIAEWFTYKHTNDDTAAVKIITDKDTDHILGAHLIGGVADELINYFAMAIQLKLTTSDLKKVTYAFPTAVSDIPAML